MDRRSIIQSALPDFLRSLAAARRKGGGPIRVKFGPLRAVSGKGARFDQAGPEKPPCTAPESRR